MTLDFPNNPTDGQQFVAEGEVWTYRSPPGVWAVGGGQGDAVQIVENDIKTVNGWIVVGDMLFQWGGLATAANGEGSKVFDQPYDDTAAPSVTLTTVANASVRVTLKNTPTSTGFTAKSWFNNDIAGGPYSMRWMAVGLAPEGLRKPKEVIEGGGVGQVVDIIDEGDGYQVVGGKLIQWGSGASSGGSLVVDLPIAYDVNDYSAQVTLNRANSGQATINKTADQLTVYTWDGSGAALDWTFEWIVIGDAPAGMEKPTRIIGADADTYLRKDTYDWFEINSSANFATDWFNVDTQFALARMGVFNTADADNAFWEISKYDAVDGTFQNSMAMYDTYTYFDKGMIVACEDGHHVSLTTKSASGQLFLAFSNPGGFWDWAFRYDAGSLFQLNRYDGAGNYFDSPLQFDYSDGTVIVQAPILFDGTGAQSWERDGNKIECWGTAVASSGGGQASIVFPKTFAGTPVVTLTGVACEAQLKALPTTTGADIETLVGGVLTDGKVVQWRAVGEWDGVS